MNNYHYCCPPVTTYYRSAQHLPQYQTSSDHCIQPKNDRPVTLQVDVNQIIFVVAQVAVFYVLYLLIMITVPIINMMETEIVSPPNSAG